MDYKEKKLLFIEQEQELLNDYRNLLEKAKVLIKNTSYMLDSNTNHIEYIDWLKHCQTADMQLLNRLFIALMYVEDQSVISQLLENVNNNDFSSIKK